MREEVAGTDDAIKADEEARRGVTDEVEVGREEVATDGVVAQVL